MSQHERRVNHPDMHAFKYQENTLHSLVPGLQRPDQLPPGSRYINRVFGISEPSLSRQTIGQAGVAVMHNSKSVASLLPSEEYDPNKYTGETSQRKHLQQIKTNMKSMDALMLRNNTSNRAYGFNYTLSPPQRKSEKQLSPAGVPSTQHYRGFSKELMPGSSRALIGRGFNIINGGD